MEIVTRFAPSPNGPLHLGHALAAIVAHDLAREAGGRFLLRIEDIDGPRSRPDMADEFRRDLEWLGLEWEDVPAQSTRLDSYAAAAGRLRERGLLYPCTCTRREIEVAASRKGPEGWVYPGTCKRRPPDPALPAALRLDIERALEATGELRWIDALAGEQVADPGRGGDVVIVRKDLPASYHLAATLDDAADGVTLVTRGADLFEATHVHRLLQALLGLPVPRWHHHRLLLDGEGRKLAKRRGSPALSDRREAGEDGLMLARQLRFRNLQLGT
ncbi:tRNA glutamyl-Q(34) synthetase GluQRS [Erythrobacter sp. HL-111]|uniref:tRNA glutamyl-Q(34) synthetase GluQRS n=1 Tax=Erythrobacter sp. HL-111 TaxID=1798193 RepID=UPI0006DBA102|nr:tRNA glutamyl-Q(34) synthetase GluQRS [Erythrobacter sp. HL-111]KPP94082.1 MAG: glutamyl-Q tRNA(Asp) synthetase GluQ [Erythrobacteraceae bacterium HL-111]SDS61338.1 glutamyl-Q tRNA(Asp) synthetase [Erythrobacter sp. HL-111]